MPSSVGGVDVNTVGVMGKGLAKSFKSIYPEMFAEYKRHCESGEFIVGRLLLYRTSHKWVLNFPTKRHWRQPSRLEDIESGLQTFRTTYAEQGIAGVAIGGEDDRAAFGGMRVAHRDGRQSDCVVVGDGAHCLAVTDRGARGAAGHVA